VKRPTPQFVIFACIAAAVFSVSLHRFIYPPVITDERGWVRVDCDDCHGTGSVEGKICELCGGNGTWGGGRCVMCLGTGKRIGVCPCCGGSGDMFKEPPRR